MTRPTMEETMLRFAELLAERSTCSRLRVGAVVTDAEMLQVLGVGYNGNAKHLPNACDRPRTKGRCGCVHAEINALLKAPGVVSGKILFSTTAPCVPCAKAAINAGIARVVYRIPYRGDQGVRVLTRAGVEVVQIDYVTRVPILARVESTFGTGADQLARKLDRLPLSTDPDQLDITNVISTSERERERQER